MRRSKRIGLTVVVLACLLAMPAATAWGQDDGAKPAPQNESFNYLDHYVVKGGWVVWFIEIPMSVAMVALTIMFALELRRSNLIPPPTIEQIRSLLEARQYREAIEYSAGDPSMVSFVVHSSLSEAANGYPAMERAMEEAIDERTAKALRKIEYLNIIGNIAPMVGLFGTVLGMIQTFNVIVKARGVPDPAALAEGISVALVTTFWGLLIAIPALSAFAMLRNQIEGVGGEAALRTQELLGMFNPSAQRAPAGPTAQPVPPRPAVVAPRPAVQPNP